MSHLLEKLKSGNVEERREAVQFLINRTVFDWVADRDEREIEIAVPSLAEALSDEDSKVRELAIEAIRIQQGEFDGKSVFVAIPKIIEVLLDPARESIRSKASIILRDAVVEGYDISKNVSDLITLLSDSNESVKFGIADSLTHYYAINEQWDEVEHLLNHPNKDVRQEAAGTLGRYETRDKIDISPIIPTLKKLLTDENKEVQYVSARSLVKFVEDLADLKRVINILLKFTSDTDSKIRNNAIGTLRDLISSKIHCTSKFPKENWEIFDPIIQLFEKLLKSGTITQKKYVAAILSKFYSHSSQLDKIQSIIKTKDPKIRKSIVGELSGCSLRYCDVDFKPLIPSLVQIFRYDKGEEVQEVAENQLKTFADRNEEYAKLIKSELEKNGYDLNKFWKFVEYLRKKMHQLKLVEYENELESVLKGSKANFLQKLLENNNSVVRAWAAYTLSVISCYNDVKISSSLPKLIQLLNDKDPFVIYNSLLALYEIAKDTSIIEALPAITKLFQSEITEVRAWAIEVLNMESKHGRDISKAIPLIDKILIKDPSGEVRAKAAIFFYEASENQVDISSAQKSLLEALIDEDKVVRDFCAWTFARHLMNKDLAQWLLDEIKTRKIKREANVRELIESCKEALKT